MEAQIEQGISQINDDPRLTPQQKAEEISVLRSHVKVIPPAGGPQ